MQMPTDRNFPSGAFIVKKSCKQYQIVTQERQGNDAVLIVHHDFGKVVRTAEQSRRARMRSIADELGLPILIESKTPLAVECRKARKEAKKQALSELKAALISKATNGLVAWVLSGYPTREVAIGELVRYCNRYVKCFPPYKERTAFQQGLLDLVYSLKDEWIKAHKEQCVEHCKSSSFTHTYVDWEELHFQRDITGEYQYEEDFTRSETTNFYAYVFMIDGREFKFHSQQVLFKEDKKSPVVPSAAGSAQPLSETEKSIPLIDACAMLASALDRYGLYETRLVQLSMQATGPEGRGCY